MYVYVCMYVCNTYVCTTTHVSSYYYICVLILLHMCSHSTTYVPSYYYTHVLILLQMCSHATTHVSSYCYKSTHRGEVIERLSAKHQTNLRPHSPCPCTLNCSLHADTHTPTQTHTTHRQDNEGANQSQSPLLISLRGGGTCRKHLRGLDV